MIKEVESLPPIIFFLISLSLKPDDVCGILEPLIYGIQVPLNVHLFYSTGILPLPELILQQKLQFMNLFDHSLLPRILLMNCF